MTRTSTRSRRLLAGTSGLAAAILTTTLMAAPAHAVPGITDVTDDTLSFNFGPATSKTETATCPAGTRVIGGGGGILGGQVGDGLVVTQMQPVRPFLGQEDFYQVTVNDPTATVDDWGVRATAICAPALSNMSIAYGYTVSSSTASQLATATCPTGRKVVGSGGTVYNAYGHAGLQVVRASTDGARVYAQAHEEAGGYTGDWSVWAWAVCATAPAGYEIVMVESQQSDSERTKNAWAECPGDKTVLGGGAATSFSAPGEVALQYVDVHGGPTSGSVNVLAAENDTTSTDWDFIVAQAICAT